MDSKTTWMPVALGLGLLVGLGGGCASQQESARFSAWSVEESRRTPVPLGSDVADHPRGAIDGQSSLSDLLAYAALESPGLEAAFGRWKASLERIPQARALPDPMLSYGYFIREVETRVGPQRQKLGLTQNLPWPGKLDARGKIAVAEAERAEAQYQAIKLALFQRVQDAYYELAFLERAREVSTENLALLADLEQVALASYRAGAAPHAAVIKAQVERGKLEDRVRELEDRRRPLSAQLNAALGRPPEATLPTPTLPEAEPIQIDEEALLSDLQESNPELAELAASTHRKHAAAALASRAYYPDLSLGADYIDTGEAHMPDTPESGKDPIMARLSLSLPLWFGQHRAGTREAEAELHAAEAAERDRAAHLRAELETALFHLRDADRKIELYGLDLIPMAEQSLRVTRQAFAAANAGFLDLIDAQRTLLEFRLSYERALADRAQRIAEVERLVGHPLPRVKPGDSDAGDPGRAGDYPDPRRE